MDNNNRQAPIGFTEEEWQTLRHDLKQCAQSMHTMKFLIDKKAINLEDIAKELEIMGKLLDKSTKAIFNERSK